MCDPFLRSIIIIVVYFFFSSRRRHTRFKCDWSSDVCSSDLGCVLKAMGRLDEALECFTRAASSKPDYVEAVVNQGSAQQELARFGEALASYTKAQQIRPDYAPAHWNEATVRLL